MHKNFQFLVIYLTNLAGNMHKLGELVLQAAARPSVIGGAAAASVGAGLLPLIA